MLIRRSAECTSSPSQQMAITRPLRCATWVLAAVMVTPAVLPGGYGLLIPPPSFPQPAGRRAAATGGLGRRRPMHARSAVMPRPTPQH